MLKSENKTHNLDIRDYLTDFYSIYPDIKCFINQLLMYKNVGKVSFLKKPAINIYKISKMIGIKKIIKVSEDKIQGKRAVIDKEKAIIKVSKNSYKEEIYFSIAHEIFHYIFWKNQGNNFPIIKEKIKVWTELLKKQDKKALFLMKRNFERSNMSTAALSDIGSKTIHLTSLSNNMDWDKVEIVAFKMDDEIEEEIADYFAANILVPTERFLLWDNKPNNEIANAFNVGIKCVNKRRDKEIEFEIDWMAPVNVASGTELGKMPSTLQEKLIHNIGGIDTHACQS